MQNYEHSLHNLPLALFISCPISPTSFYSNHTSFEFSKRAEPSLIQLPLKMFIPLKHPLFLHILYVSLNITSGKSSTTHTK